MDAIHTQYEYYTEKTYITNEMVNYLTHRSCPMPFRQFAPIRCKN